MSLSPDRELLLVRVLVTMDKCDLEGSLRHDGKFEVSNLQYTSWYNYRLQAGALYISSMIKVEMLTVKDV